MQSNGGSAAAQQTPLQRADEAEDLLDSVKASVIQFIRAADEDAATKGEGHGLQRDGQGPRTTLVEHHPPKKLQKLLDLHLPDQGQGKDGLLDAVNKLLKYSVNTWDQGFLDKLYASTTPVGLAADLLLSSLNTNLHVYQVSPALTIVEKQTAKALATMFGLKGPFAGGVSQPGGSAANQTSMVIARNCLFPETKTKGYEGKRFVVFTSAHGHYSAEKAAQMFGFGSEGVKSVPVDEKGCMKPAELDRMVQESLSAGETPFYVNATAGTTVLGSFDPLDAIADVCERHNLWLHVDGSWGGPVIFSEKQRHKLAGSHRADTIALCPHKMMSVPLTCTFLLGNDLRKFHKGMTLPAGYLFHASDDNDDNANADSSAIASHAPSDAHPPSHHDHHNDNREIFDLADLTPQCGRRGDSLKLALSWIYSGTAGYAAYIDAAFATAAHLADLIAKHPDFTLVSENPPPCLQVCFYFRKQPGEGAAKGNSRTTEEVSRRLVPRGFMVDYAPGEEGRFFRVVVSGQTRWGTVEGLVKAIEEVGEGVKV
ncbi:Glutamate decarboxylase 2 [Friedmanniomyces endolithicus]|nr:Glutamate decarboxylase 2 [Friedmanniomyces endolithicus]